MTVVAELLAKLGLVSDHGSFEAGHRLIEGVKAKLEFAIGAEAVHGIEEMVMSVVELGSSLNDTSQKTGQSVESLQFYGFVAKLNSSSAESLTHSVTKLSRVLVEAEKGTGEAGESLKKLGIDMNSPEFKNANVDKKFQIIAEHMAKLPDGAQKTAIAMNLFGRSGAELIPTLNDLGKNGEELRAKFEELGGGLTKEQTVALDEFGDQVDMAKFGLGQLKNQIVVALLPTLKEMIEGFMEWIKTNREVIKSTVEGIGQALEMVIEGVVAVGGALGEAIAYLGHHKDLLQVILIALGAIIAAFAVDAAISWVVAFAPLLIAAGVVTAIIVVVKKLWEMVRGAEGTWEDFAESARGAVDSVWEWFQDLPDHIKDALVAVYDVITYPFRKAFEWLSDKFDWVMGKVDAVKNFFGGGGDVAGVLQNRINQTVSGIDQRAFQAAIPAPDSAPEGALVQVSHSPTFIVNPTQGMSETELAKKIGDISKENLNETFQKAFDAFKGGKR